MSMGPRRKLHFGVYGENGVWKRFKHCVKACPADKCGCGPPNGLHYDPRFDKEAKEYIEDKRERWKISHDLS